MTLEAAMTQQDDQTVIPQPVMGREHDQTVIPQNDSPNRKVPTA